MLISPVLQLKKNNQLNITFGKQKQQNQETKSDKILLYSLAGFTGIMSLILFDRTSKTRLQKFFVKETETQTKNLKQTIPQKNSLEIKSFKDNDAIKSINELAGLEELKAFINKYKTLLDNNQAMKEHNIESFTSILLWGLPGTGKTSAAMGIAKKLDADFIPLNKELFDSEYVSEGPRHFSGLINQIEQHAQKHPEKKIVVFMDEIDGTMSIDKGNNLRHSEDLTNVLKKSITDLQEKCDNIIFIGATNKDPNGIKSDNTAVRLNTAILSRFNYQFELALPQPRFIKESWSKLVQTQSGKEKFTEKQNEIIAQKFYELGMSYRDVKNISNKMNIEDAVEFCKNGSYNSKKNLIKVLREDEKIGYDAVKKQGMEQKRKESIIKELEESLSKQN